MDARIDEVSVHQVDADVGTCGVNPLLRKETVSVHQVDADVGTGRCAPT